MQFCSRLSCGIGIPISRPRFVIQYPDHTKHVGAAERDDLLLSEEITPIGENVYRFIGKPRTLHCMSDLSQLLPALSNPQNMKRRYLPGSWILELAGKRRRQLEETAEALGYRLKRALA